mmetsp:Transcript_20358/g.36215  ORF Transcript_20358/g.36215 Transcript_20358/m.36215 type:complete len:365 (+) Transcript_20358:86-1180(+)
MVRKRVREPVEDPFAVNRKSVVEAREAAKAEKASKVRDPSKPPKTGAKAPWKKREARTVYMNQLPYEATKDEIKAFAAKARGVSLEDVEDVRMIRSKDKKFKGIAFVQMSSDATRDAVLELHKTKMGDRPVNVTLCISKEAAREKTKRKREETGGLLPDEAAEVFATAKRATKHKGRLEMDDFDAGVKKIIASCTAAELLAALHEFAEHDSGKTKLKNRNSFLMTLLLKHKGGINPEVKRQAKEKSLRAAKAGKHDSKAKSDASGSSSKGPVIDKSIPMQLSIEEVQNIIASLSKPRRMKKQDGKGRGGMTPKRWDAFNTKCLTFMRYKSAPQLKRALGAFYKTPGFDNVNNKSELWLSEYASM